jgi:hypothetical protein
MDCDEEPLPDHDVDLAGVETVIWAHDETLEHDEEVAVVLIDPGEQGDVDRLLERGAVDVEALGEGSDLCRGLGEEIEPDISRRCQQ